MNKSEMLSRLRSRLFIRKVYIERAPLLHLINVNNFDRYMHKIYQCRTILYNLYYVPEYFQRLNIFEMVGDSTCYHSRHI